MSTRRPTDNDDNLTPQSAPNFLSSGDDQLNARRGDDVVRGDGGDDTLRGDGGMDTLFGGADDDTLFGGAEGDILFGGPGDDTFAYAVAGHVAGDRLRDFEDDPGNDTIDLSAVAGLNAVVGLVDSAGQVGAGEVGFIDAGDDVRLVVNPVGNGASDRVSLVIEDIEVGGTIGTFNEADIIA
jgi:Ca2+-binding RTX toxin-like protein